MYLQHFKKGCQLDDDIRLHWIWLLQKLILNAEHLSQISVRLNLIWSWRKFDSWLIVILAAHQDGHGSVSGEKKIAFLCVKFYIAATTCSSIKYCIAFREISETARDSFKGTDGYRGQANEMLERPEYCTYFCYTEVFYLAVLSFAKLRLDPW